MGRNDCAGADVHATQPVGMGDTHRARMPGVVPAHRPQKSLSAGSVLLLTAAGASFRGRGRPLLASMSPWHSWASCWLLVPPVNGRDRAVNRTRAHRHERVDSGKSGRSVAAKLAGVPRLTARTCLLIVGQRADGTQPDPYGCAARPNGQGPPVKEPADQGKNHAK